MFLMLHVISWILSMILIALIVAIFDEVLKTKVEENQTIAAFFIFILPTLMEFFAWYYFNRPFMFGAP